MQYISQLRKFILLLAMFISCTRTNNLVTINPNDGNVITVNTYIVKEVSLTPEIKTFGTLSFKSKIDIHPKTNGRIERILVEQGDRVNRGQVLATLEQLQLQLELRQAEAEHDAAKSSLELSKAKYADALRDMEKQFLTIEKAKEELDDKRNYLTNLSNRLENNRKLLDAGAIAIESFQNLETEYYSSQTQTIIAERNLLIQEIGFRDIDITRAGHAIPTDKEAKLELLKRINSRLLEKEIAVAESSVKKARTRVDSVKTYLEETFIRAPQRGIVAVRYQDVGETGKPETKMFTLMDTNQVYARINISESDLKRIKPNGEVEILVDSLDRKSFTGVIELISPIVDSKTRTVEVSVLLNNLDSKLKPGMFIRARIKSNESKQAIFIPSEALVSVDKEEAEVFVVRNNDLVLKRRISLSSEHENMVEVISGLEAGDIIVERPPITLLEGAKINVRE